MEIVQDAWVFVLYPTLSVMKSITHPAPGHRNPGSKLTVREVGGLDRKGRPYMVCDCDCGSKCNITVKALRRAHTRSCGCLSRPKPIVVSDLLALRWAVIQAKFNGNTEGCWEWAGTKNPGGYGVVQVQNRIYLVHRLALAMATTSVGDVFNAPEAAHRCDNPGCCNPEHLFPATHAENHEDAVSKGRYQGHPGGKGHAGVPPVKLTEKSAQEIRDLRAKGSTIASLAELFNITSAHVRAVITNRVWVPSSTKENA